MAYILLPSLKEITLMKIAFQMLHSSELKKYIFKHLFNTNSKDVEYLMPNIIKISNTVELPINLKDNFYELIYHMVKQLMEWTVWEPRVTEFSLYKIIFDMFCWTTCGTIDKKKTAIELVNCHCLPDAYRYEIASKYCLSNCFNSVNHQYGEMIENVFHDDDDDDMTPCLKLVKLWSYKIGCNEEFSQDDILKGLFLTLGLGNDIGGKYFWDKLSTDDQNSILDDLESYSDMISNENILAFLFSRMNGIQILNVLTTSDDGGSFYFLNESLQQIYSEICKKLWKLICSEEFDLIFNLWLSFLETIVTTIVKGFGKYSSLKDFYKNSPIKIKKYIIRKYSNGEWINKCLENEEYNCDLIPKIIVLLKECGAYTKQLANLFCEKLLTHGKEYLAEEFANSFISSMAEIKEFHQNVFLSVKNGVWFTDLIIKRRWADIKNFLCWSHISDCMLNCLNGNYNIFDDYMFDILDIFSVSFLYLSELIDKIVFQFEKAEEKIYPSFEEILEMIFPNYDLQHLKQFLLDYFIKYAKYIKIISDEKVEVIEKQVESFLKGELKIRESRKKIFDLKIRNVQIIDLILLDIPKQFKNFAIWHILTDTVLFEKKISTVLKECLSQNLFDENDLKYFIHLINNEFFPENGILKFKTEIAFLLPAVYYNETNIYLNSNTFPNFCYSILNEDKVLTMEILSSMTSVDHIRELLLKDNFTSVIDSSFFKMMDEYEVLKWKEQTIFSLLKDKKFEEMIYDNYFEVLDNFLNWCSLSREKVKTFKKELLFRIINKYYNQENKIKHIMKEIDEFTDFCLTSNTIFLITFTEWHANVLTPFVHWSGRFSTNAETTNLTSSHLKVQHYSRLFDSHEDFTNFLIENCLFKYFYRNCGIRRFVEWFGLSERELKKELFLAGVTPFDNNDIINIIENKIPLDSYVTSLISIEEILESKESLVFRLIMSYFKKGFSEVEETEINRVVDILFLSDDDKIKFKKKCIFCFELNHLPQQILQSSLHVNTIDFYMSIFLFSEEDVNEFKQSLFQYLKLNLCTEFADHSYGGFCYIKDIVNWFCLSEKESIGYKKEILNSIRDNGFFHPFISSSEIFVLDDLLSWGLSNSSETVNFKHSLCYYLCNNLTKCELDFLDNLDIATFFIEWCTFPPNQIMAIKKQLLYSAIVESKLHILIYMINEFRIEELSKWVFSDQKDTRDFKMIFFSSVAIQNIYLSYCGKRKNFKRMKNSHSMHLPC